MLLVGLRCVSEGPDCLLPFVNNAQGGRVPQFNLLPGTRVNIFMFKNGARGEDFLP